MTFTDDQLTILSNITPSANLTFLADIVGELESTTQSNHVLLVDAVNTAWIILCASLVFFMQAGFAMLTAGCVRAKNVRNVLLKNLLDGCIGAVGFYALGYAFAFGQRGEGAGSENAYIGDRFFFLSEQFDKPGKLGMGHFFFQWSFAATTVTIVSGAVAERTQLAAYLLYAFFLTSFVYPVVVHWEWSSTGWLSPFNLSRDDILFNSGMIDFAGDGAVHMVGGLTALIAAYFVGPRIGRFNADGSVNEEGFQGHDISLATIGTFILWFGWYGFNCGSTLVIVGYHRVAATAAVNTTLSASVGALAAILTQRIINKNSDPFVALNGAIAGLVSITASCAVVEPWAAITIGVIGGNIYFFARILVQKMRIDDVLDASAIHLGCGMWGLIACAFFATPGKLERAYGSFVADEPGIFYGGANLLGANLIAILSIIAWVSGMMIPFFWILGKLRMLRVPLEVEEKGLDLSKHGGYAYPETMNPATAGSNGHSKHIIPSETTSAGGKPLTALQILQQQAKAEMEMNPL